MPLPCDMVFERDVALTMRNGTTIYTDVFRPVGEGKHPAIVAWSPYGKEIGGSWLDDLPDRSGVPLDWVSELQKFEAPDPAFWVNHGYAVLNPDPRGAYKSEGDLNFWGKQLAEDGYDFIEWAAAQPWSNDKVGMAGNSWLAASQWFIAAEQPPHLAAIAPWEGFCDCYRDVAMRGGLPMTAFPEVILTTFAGENLAEDLPRMIVENPQMNAYWQDKIADLARIRIPAYVVASYTNHAHTHGTFAAFRGLASKEKWLRVNNTNEWLDFYTLKYTAELLQFFNRYLKDEQNGWEATPRVRICVLDDGHEDIVDRAEADFPLSQTEYKPLYLQANQLSDNPLAAADTLSYDALQGCAEFSYQFATDTELTGYMKLKLWVQADGSDDMELAVTVEKRNADNQVFVRTLGEGVQSPAQATGYLRVSQRALDTARSTPSEPYLTFNQPQPLGAGEIVPIEIGIWPMAMRFHKGEKLVLTVKPHTPVPTDMDMGFGSAKIPVPVDVETFHAGENVKLRLLGGSLQTDPAFVKEQLTATPQSRNQGKHIIHFGGQYDSHLLIPVNPTSTNAR